MRKKLDTKNKTKNEKKKSSVSKALMEAKSKAIQKAQLELAKEIGVDIPKNVEKIEMQIDQLQNQSNKSHLLISHRIEYLYKTGLFKTSPKFLNWVTSNPEKIDYKANGGIKDAWKHYCKERLGLTSTRVNEYLRVARTFPKIAIKKYPPSILIQILRSTGGKDQWVHKSLEYYKKKKCSVRQLEAYIEDKILPIGYKKSKKEKYDALNSAKVITGQAKIVGNEFHESISETDGGVTLTIEVGQNDTIKPIYNMKKVEMLIIDVHGRSRTQISSLMQYIEMWSRKR